MYRASGLYRKSMWSRLVLVAPGGFRLTMLFIWHILYLTRQPVREVNAPRPGEILSCVSRLLYQSQGGLLIFWFRIAIISNATFKIIINSSYVLISNPLLSRLRTGTAAALLAAQVNILYFLYAPCASWHRGQISFIAYSRLSIAYWASSSVNFSPYSDISWSYIAAGDILMESW